MMVLTVFIALVSAVIVQSIRLARRDRELARLTLFLAEYQRASDRLEWAERMHKRGYVSQAQLNSEKVSFDRAKLSLSQQD
jgi:hypothetical protein